MAKGQHTREAIVEAAIALLGHEGPDGFSAATLARAAGTSKANVFHHFPVLDEIPLAAFDRLADRILASVPDTALPTREWVAELGRGVRRMVHEQRDDLNAYFVFFGNALFDPEMRDRMRKRQEPYLKAIAGRLARDGRSAAEARAIARLVIAALDGLALHLMVSDRDGEIVAAWETLLDRLLPEDN